MSLQNAMEDPMEERLMYSRNSKTSMKSFFFLNRVFRSKKLHALFVKQGVFPDFDAFDTQRDPLICPFFAEAMFPSFVSLVSFRYLSHENNQQTIWESGCFDLLSKSY